MTTEHNNYDNDIVVRGAREHNLKGINVDIPRDQITVITGISGSGKSSLAFDTIYAEGQRRYIESLSTYARQFLDQIQKPDVELIEGLPPTIAIEQRTCLPVLALRWRPLRKSMTIYGYYTQGSAPPIVISVSALSPARLSIR
ncbi:MAG: excinuclease ABC subunit A [Candidatus Brocadia fulgida]|uniref:UvrABC system protein A n=1 Tax=Candidatus Brocadia fulgida TaxID=380242 RepID=A0A0M2UV04_9BACT|nr:MAG: excinuclease ABC subunit A [Candidatus Brocadia fulgida]